MKPTYAVRGWNQHFENHDTRKLRVLRFLLVPNKHDGKSYRRIAMHPQSVEVFCAWSLILQVASKMPVRGVLEDEDGPLDSEDLQAKTGFPAAIFDVAFEVLTSERVGWMEVATPGDAGRPAGGAGTERETAGDSGTEAGESPGRREGKGTDGKGREQTTTRAGVESSSLSVDLQLAGEYVEFCIQQGQRVKSAVGLARYIVAHPDTHLEVLQWKATRTMAVPPKPMPLPKVTCSKCYDSGVTRLLQIEPLSVEYCTCAAGKAAAEEKL